MSRGFVFFLGGLQGVHLLLSLGIPRDSVAFSSNPAPRAVLLIVRVHHCITYRIHVLEHMQGMTNSHVHFLLSDYLFNVTYIVDIFILL